MSRLGGIFAGIGLGLLAVSLLADVIGIGSGPGFGNLQITGIIVGAVLTAVGLVVTVKKKKDED